MGGLGRIFGKLNIYNAAKNLFLKIRRLKYKYMVDGNPLITFLKKIEVDGPRPDLGLDFGGFQWIFGKLAKIAINPKVCV